MSDARKAAESRVRLLLARLERWDAPFRPRTVNVDADDLRALLAEQDGAGDAIDLASLPVHFIAHLPRGRVFMHPDTPRTGVRDPWPPSIPMLSVPVAPAPSPAPPKAEQDGAGALHFVCTDFPGPGAECVFVECEDSTGRSINAGEWVRRPDGLAALVVSRPAPPPAGGGFDPICPRCRRPLSDHHPDHNNDPVCGDFPVDTPPAGNEVREAAERLRLALCAVPSWEALMPRQCGACEGNPRCGGDHEPCGCHETLLVVESALDLLAALSRDAKGGE